MYFTPGQACSVRVPFVAGGRPAVPDSGSVRYTIYGEGLAAVSGSTNVSASVPAGSAALVVTVSALINTTSLRVSPRKVGITFTSGGAPASSEVLYRLAAPPPVWVSPADVRGLLGAARDEVRDDEVDLFEAYLEVENTLGASVLSAALAAGSRPTVLANRAVAHQAALALVPSLQARLAQQRGNGLESYARFDGVDPVAAGEALAGRLRSCLQELSGVSDAEASVALLILTTPTDPVTGV